MEFYTIIRKFPELHIRWNVLYIIPLILFSLAVFNNNKLLNNNYFTIIFISIIILQTLYYNKSYYNNQGYNPKNMIELSKLIKGKNNLSIVGIGTITDEKKEIIRNQRNDYLNLDSHLFTVISQFLVML